MILRGLALLFLSLPLAAQTETRCSTAALDRAAATAIALRHQLHDHAAKVYDPTVPPAVATQLTQLKDALAEATAAVFRCAPVPSTAARLESTLATALHANLAADREGVTLTSDFGHDHGSYGAGLTVQVVPLFNAPQTFEVDLRYAIECGDDNLLLLYQASPNNRFHQLLRLSAPAYTNVSGALGDFLLLTPLTGNPDHPDWRFVVAHGQPGCAATPRPSTFTLDLLRPTADPSHPATDWHFTHPYTQSPTLTPRLITTEDTIEFRFIPEGPKTPKPAAPEVYRFHLTANGIEPTAPPQ